MGGGGVFAPGCGLQCSFIVRHCTIPSHSLRSSHTHTHRTSCSSTREEAKPTNPLLVCRRWLQARSRAVGHASSSS